MDIRRQVLPEESGQGSISGGIRERFIRKNVRKIHQEKENGNAGRRRISHMQSQEKEETDAGRKKA